MAVIKKGEKRAKKEIPSKKFSDPQVIQLGKDLLKWIKKNKDDHTIVHLSQWYVEEEDMSRTEFKTLLQRLHFQAYYEKALDLMGNKILINKELPTAYGSRFLSRYHQDLRKHEKEISFEKIDHEAKVKASAEINKQIAPNDDKLERLLDSLKVLAKDKE